MITRHISVILLFSLPALGITIPFDCNREIPLQTAVDFAFPGETLLLSGACKGPLVITAKDITLTGRSTVSFDGQHKDGITVNGPARVVLNNLDISGGANGVHGISGAHLTITNTTIHDNGNIGLLIEGSSSAVLSESSTNHNGLNGIDAEGSSAVTISGGFKAERNGVFGININGASSLTLNAAKVLVDHNTLGVQMGTSASAFIADPGTTLTVNDNLTTGLTIVSGSHMVDFGGVIVTTGNGVHGVSIDSKAGLDLDAAGSLTSTGNMQDGVHLEETSVLTMFNTTAFSGAPGTTTLTATGNAGNGISVLTGSNLTVIHQAAIFSNHNKQAGIMSDDGSSLTIIGSAITGNAPDITLSFGSRADITTSTVGTVTCDATTLLRGTTGVHCPH